METIIEQNTLYPVFFKLNRFNTLIAGGGKVALEKLSFILKSSPNANVTVVAPEIDDQATRRHDSLLRRVRSHHRRGERAGTASLE